MGFAVVEAPPEQRVQLFGETVYTTLDKPFRHLRTSIHWSREVYSVRNLPDYTLAMNGYFPALPDLVRHFSEYYPHVFFRVREAGSPDRLFKAGRERPDLD